MYTGLLPGRLLVHLHTPRIGHVSTSSLLESTLMTNITDIQSHNIELSHLCRNTAPEQLPEINAEDYENTALGRAYELISDWSGIHNLVMQDCFNIPKGHSVPPKWFASMYDDCIQPENLETVNVLAAYLDEEVKFASCPTQKHMHYMTDCGCEWVVERY
jgi:hypothetical protein